MTPANESNVLARAREGDRAAFEALIVPQLPPLLAYIRAICGDYHAAHDALQLTLLVAFRKLKLFFPEADFSVWLRAIARREALEARKKLARGPSTPIDRIEAFYENPSPTEASPRYLALGDCLRALGGRMAQVVRGHYFEGSTLETLGVKMGVTATAAKQLLYRARLSLRECIRKRSSAEASS